MKTISFKNINFLMVFLLLITMMALFVSCKDKNSSPSTICPEGYVFINNSCQYLGGNGGVYPSQIPSPFFLQNGRVSSESQYKAFTKRFTGTNYYSCHNVFSSCAVLQVSLQKRSETDYVLFLKSPIHPPTHNVISIPVQKIQTPSNPNGFIFQAIYTNPYPYVPINLWIQGDLSQGSTSYQLHYEGNSIASGSMVKGVDYL